MVVGRDRGGAKPASQLASFPSMEFVSEAMALNRSYGDGGGADGGFNGGGGVTSDASRTYMHDPS